MSDLTLEDVLIYEGRDFRPTSGSSGPQLQIRACPNCGKEKWKVYASADRSLGNCFSCNQKFNMFRFVSWLLVEKGGAGTDRDVVTYLNEARRTLGYRPKKDPMKVSVATTEGDFELPFSTPLPYEDGKNHPYLEGRGITGDVAGAFGLRYSLFGWHGYKNEKGEDVRQSFAERIIIPVHNLDGLCVTFQGRDITGTSETRYKFAGGLPGTARYLYNGHTARALKATHVVLNEGPFDVIGSYIALSQAPDLKGVIPIGSFGMHLSATKEGDDQLGAFGKLRNEGLQTVTIMWDAEPAAFERALDAALMLSKIGLQTRIATLPAGQDPGDADATVIQRAVREAQEVNRLSAMRMRMSNPYRL